MISLELIASILSIAPIILFVYFVVPFVARYLDIRDIRKINKIIKAQIMSLYIPILSLLFDIRYFISFVIRYDDKKLSDINEIIKEVEISEKQKIANLKYNQIPTLDQERKISEKFLNSDLIEMSNISRIEMEDVFEGEIESVPFISADLFVYEYQEVEDRERLSLSGTYYYFDIPTIGQGVNIILVPRIPFAVFIFLMLIFLFFLLGSIYKNIFVSILISIFFIVSLIVYYFVYYFEGSKTESIKFNSYFVLQTNDEIKARKILTSAVIQSIIDLKEKEGEIMIAIKEGQLHVVIKNKDRFNYMFNFTKMKENIAQEVRQEIDLIKRLLKSIRLKETLYKKGIIYEK